MKPIVYIVHHVDTEGPLYEDIKETFKRLEDILHIKLNIKRISPLQRKVLTH